MTDSNKTITNSNSKKTDK